MKFKADEITSVIQREIEQFHAEVTKSEVGRVLEVGDGIARVHGLSGVMTGEMLAFDNGVKGLAFNLEESSVGVTILASSPTSKRARLSPRRASSCGCRSATPWSAAWSTPWGCRSIPRGRSSPEHSRAGRLGRGGDRRSAAGRRADADRYQGDRLHDADRPRSARADHRRPQDAGKTAIALDAILSQKGQGVICIYVAVAQKESTTAALVDVLRHHGAMDLHDRCVRRAPATPPRSSTSPRTPAVRWPSTSCTKREARPSSSTTTCRSRPSPTANSPFLLPPPAWPQRPIRATSSTPTAPPGAAPAKLANKYVIPLRGLPPPPRTSP